MARKRKAIPKALEDAAEVFAAWRRSRTKRRIPDRLWEHAVRLAKRYGVYPTARVLHLDYTGLKRRVEAPVADRSGAFVELVPSATPTGSSSVTTVTLETPDGSRMEVRSPVAGLDIVAVIHAFRGGRS